MSEEAVAVPVSKDNSLVQQTPTTTKNLESQKPKRKQEYTDIVNSLIQQTSTKSKNTESQKPKRKQEYTDIVNWLMQQASTPKK